jgi:hypothetical protein
MVRGAAQRTIYDKNNQRKNLGTGTPHTLMYGQAARQQQ